LEGGYDQVSKREPIFTERELDVMAILWRRGTGTVVEVREELDDPLAYTTVLTILRTLEEKGFVGHKEEGRAHRYQPLVSQSEAQEAHLSRIQRKLFDDSPVALVSRLLDQSNLSRAEAHRVREIVVAKVG